MKCPNCNSELEPGNRFCGACGAVVASQDNTQTNSFCGNCGSVIPEGESVCPSCGMPKDMPEEEKKTVYPDPPQSGIYTEKVDPPKRGISGVTIAVIAASAAVAVAAAVFGYIWISSDEYESGGGNGKETAVTATETVQTATAAPVTAAPAMTPAPSAMPIPTVPPSYDYAQSAMGYYTFPSDRQYITQADLDVRSRDEIRLILNEMYARHGYIFSSPQYRQYFESQPWYRGTSTDQEAVASYFNAYETANKNFIIQYEEAHGWR